MTFVNYKRPQGRTVIEAMIDASAIIGPDSVVWWYARILAGVRIGANCSIGGGTEIGRGSVIGDNTRVGANAFLPPNTIVGANVFIGPGVVCTDDKHPHIHSPGELPYLAQPPVIEEGAAIGAGAVLLPGVRIGKYARVAAGAIVTKDVAERGMVRGQPARPRTMPPEWEHPEEHVAECAAIVS
jgi:UDP-2-acetamido-3-amino-2,3-dideoxy-glucuronate N-acetyltransferase